MVSATSSVSSQKHVPNRAKSHVHEQDVDEELVQAAAQADGNVAPDLARQKPRLKATKQPEPEVDPAVHEQRLNKLKFLLQRSGVYSRIMGEKMEKERKARAEQAAKLAARQESKSSDDPSDVKQAKNVVNGRTTRAGDADTKSTAAPTTRAKRDGPKKRGKDDYDVSSYLGDADIEAAKEETASSKKRQKTEASTDVSQTKQEQKQAVQEHRTQPKLVTGAKMRDYQLDGLEWLVSLYENGLNGILADEMGLGKTLQSISFLAHLREKGVWGPFLIVAPLSTINNWVLEFGRFTPDVPAIMYHGTAEERREMRDKYLQLPTIKSEQQLFPVVVTSYEVVIRDRVHLAHYPWKFIVVDEGHRLKNMDCKLIRELKTYKSANRLILTGTPLHNNLAELWSLLNFILPDIFDDLATFEQWFDFSDIHEEQGSQRILSKESSSSVITQLHEILKPFLLRRLKADVESNLPPKKEYLLYAPLTKLQKEMYDAVVSKDIRKWILVRKTGLAWEEIQSILQEEGQHLSFDTSTVTSRASSPQTETGSPSSGSGSRFGTPKASNGGSGASTPRRTSARRAKKMVEYKLDDDEGDGSYFRRLEDESSKAPRVLSPKEAERQGKLFQIREAQKAINNMHLENMVMQARKICNHPFLFDWPIDRDTGLQVVNRDLINASGKMLMLNRLLDALFAKGHKVLIFSQFTTMLDIIEDWASEYKGLRTCRIDGSTSQVDRREQMRSFNEDKGPDACNLFLLSTRAGGLGINLVAADTVIFYDSDWNPQMDLQAQDRVHRIGQTKPCLIFRLVAANTVEQRILKRAGNKRKLEALVIQQGKFKLPAGYMSGGSSARKRKEEAMAEMASSLMKLESERVQLAGEDDEIISDANLAKLLDRSEAAYARRTGWVTSIEGEEGEADKDGVEGSRMAFEVTETVADEANEEIAKLLAGDH
ncbi:hypothetical protein IE53DRAFT_323394 [Violaceomyces palustris]|uniref:Uncharacterized protein n=1 Tax=Violaceomyces palustris TaxID=1673888 RepID=A0ACD0P813_9BASI|nr:hypothetical protein IE53DRAFT_323394 [Violaceomyces palustris]